MTFIARDLHRQRDLELAYTLFARKEILHRRAAATCPIPVLASVISRGKSGSNDTLMCFIVGGSYRTF